MVNNCDFWLSFTTSSFVGCGHPTNDDVVNYCQKTQVLTITKKYFLDSSRRDTEFVDANLKRFFYGQEDGNGQKVCVPNRHIYQGTFQNE